ncbi:MAG: hypothetical protein ACR2QM_09570 [Longimicrobiales bacterium]
MLRALVSVGMNLAGMILVFVAVLTPAVSVNLQLQVIIVLIGVLLVQGSVWKFTNPCLPSERRYDDLRNEVDDFIDLVRDLNNAATSAQDTRALDQADKIEGVLSKMHMSVDQMGRLAGREISFAYLPEPLEELAEVPPPEIGPLGKAPTTHELR